MSRGAPTRSEHSSRNSDTLTFTQTALPSQSPSSCIPRSLGPTQLLAELGNQVACPGAELRIVNDLLGIYAGFGFARQVELVGGRVEPRLREHTVRACESLPA